MNILQKTKKKIKEANKILERWQFSTKKDDIFIVSYPKSGNTWMVFFLANYISEDNITFENFTRVIPDVQFNPEDMKSITSSPRFFKSHFRYKSTYKNIIYLLRDGRDVAVSYYFDRIRAGKITEDTSFEVFLHEVFLQNKAGYDGWGEHIRSWEKAKAANDQRILFLKYEDLKQHPEAHFRKVVDFAGLAFSQEKFDKALAQTSVKKMQKTERQSEAYFHEERNLKKTNYGFVRKGEIGDWKNHFDKEDEAAFKAKYGEALECFGYLS